MDVYKSRKYVHIKSNLVKKAWDNDRLSFKDILVAKQVMKGS